METRTELAAIVRGELALRAESVATEFDALLRDYDLVCRWLATDLTDEMRAHFTLERRVRAERIVACLVTWRGLGGSFQFAPGVSLESSSGPVAELNAPTDGSDLSGAGPPHPEGPEPALVPVLDVAPASPSPVRAVTPASVVRTAAPVPLAEPWEDQLLELLPELVPASADRDEFDRIDALFKRREEWRDVWPRKAVLSLLSYITCRANAIQDRASKIPGLTGLFQSVGGFRKDLGFDNIHGLARKHQPEGGSWSHDANRHMDDLLACLRLSTVNPGVFRAAVAERKAAWKETDRRLPEADAKLQRLLIVIRAAVAGGLANNTQFVNLVAELEPQLGGPTFRTLRQKIRDTQNLRAPAEEELEDDGPTDELERLFASWAHLPLTRGKRAIIFGGTPIPQAKDRLQRAFGFAQLEWKDGEFKNGIIENVRATVASGTVDLVLMLRRIVGHNSSKIVDACKDTGTPFVFVDGSCSVARVKLGIERYLTAPETSDAQSA